MLTGTERRLVRNQTLVRDPASYEPGNQAGNFSPVDRVEVQETKPKWWNITCLVRDCRSFVDSCNFTRILLKLCCETEVILELKFVLDTDFL